MCSKNCEINNILAIMELCAFYNEYKKVKFTAINFHGRTNVKYFMQTQPLQFCKDAAKFFSLSLLKKTVISKYFLPAKKIPILWIELQTNKHKRSQKLTSKNLP